MMDRDRSWPAQRLGRIGRGLRPYTLVSVGGFAGANARALVDGVLGSLQATLTVNAIGSLLLGFLLYEAVAVGTISRPTRTLLGSGFLASLTTYSTFAVQTTQAPVLVAAGNVAANYALGLGAVRLGRQVALALARRVES
jgi:CrcB protein